MSESKKWPELVGQTFEQASQVILAFDNNLHPYNAKNGMQNRMYDPKRVVCVTDNNGVVTEPPHYTNPH
ncbi:unnamed protein product [Rotaria sordida]|uniref:Uncharacterized protein n=1 Tax=Rotaria sordida TaxID=392033 RepID=A0A815NPF8_9BILA|nr:unnamed protein product [Rotaria sordida]CAF1177670.1 unnamed protein product [Rotaria sordida]CAF1436537.1 unnamed protein product [Rotaria sordida]CAF3664944.1 unnamed protein product [Rotaria sordida]